MISYIASIVLMIVAVIVLYASFKYQMDYFDPKYKTIALLLQVAGSLIMGLASLVNCMDAEIKPSTLAISYILMVVMTFAIFSKLVSTAKENDDKIMSRKMDNNRR